MVKNKIRKSLSEQGQSISDSSKSNISFLIQENVLEKINTHEMQNIALYFPFRNEVNTNLLIQAFTKLKKNIYIPKVIDDEMMAFNLLDEQPNFFINQFGIKEVKSEDYVNINEIDLMFIPMAGVDLNGYRLGYGSGYFDRIIGSINEEVSRPLLVGLCYQYQICNMHFGEKHDLKYDYVFSENNQMISYHS